MGLYFGFRDFSMCFVYYDSLEQNNKEEIDIVVLFVYMVL